MKNQAYRMAMLFDFYGDLLTERQREFYDLYYNEDLSLAEIAENYGISRQGVRDVIVRAEAAMTEIEDKTHIIRRFQQSRQAIAAISQAADKLLQSIDRRSSSISASSTWSRPAVSRNTMSLPCFLACSTAALAMSTGSI